MFLSTPLTYYPYGEPVVEPEGQRYLFGGKEREHGGGRNSYDFGARSLTPYGNWSTVDPLTEKFYPISPYSYCGGDPVNFVDRDGKSPHIIVLAIVGAAVDAGTQVVEHMLMGETFSESVSKIDVTSVFASGATSAVAGPGAGKVAKLFGFAVDVVDIGVDINSKEIKYIGGDGDADKSLMSGFVDFLAKILPGKMMKDTSTELILNAGGAQLTKEEGETALTFIFSLFSEGYKKKEEMDKEKEQTNNK